MKLKSRATRITLIIMVMVVGVVAYYAFLSGRSKENKKAENMTAVEEVLSRDLSTNYPPTPKEVMKYYNSIVKCLYYEECTEDEIESLGIKMRELYDTKLLEANELGTYLIKLQNDVDEYKDSERKITSTSVAASTNVDYYTRDGYSFARLLCTYNINEKGTSSTLRMIFLLRKDSDKKWKIYGWDLEENVDLNGDGILGD